MFKKTQSRAAVLETALKNLDKKKGAATQEEINDFLKATYDFLAQVPQSGSMYGTNDEKSEVQIHFYHR